MRVMSACFLQNRSYYVYHNVIFTRMHESNPILPFCTLENEGQFRLHGMKGKRNQ